MFPACLKAESCEQVPALPHSSNIICLILCLCRRASISLGRVRSSWGSVSSQEGRGGRFCSRGPITDATSKKTDKLGCSLYFWKKIKTQVCGVQKHSSQLISVDQGNNLPLSTGPPRSSSLRDSSSLKAWFLWRRPGVKPQIGLSTGRATSTSWVTSANRITSWARRAHLL